VVFGHFDAFRQLFLHVIRNMQHFFKLIAVRAVEREELEHLRLASNGLSRVMYCLPSVIWAADALKARIIPASASQIFS
jgi:hypothetical protein